MRCQIHTTFYARMCTRLSPVFVRTVSLSIVPFILLSHQYETTVIEAIGSAIRLTFLALCMLPGRRLRQPREFCLTALVPQLGELNTVFPKYAQQQFIFCGAIENFVRSEKELELNMIRENTKSESLTTTSPMPKKPAGSIQSDLQLKNMNKGYKITLVNLFAGCTSRYSYGILWRLFECIFGQCNDLRWSNDGIRQLHYLSRASRVPTHCAQKDGRLG